MSLIFFFFSSPFALIRNDEELNKLFGNVTIPDGGVIPNIPSALLPKTVPVASNGEKKTKKVKAAESAEH